MIERLLTKLCKIDEKTGIKIREAGICTWDDFIKADSIPGITPGKKKKIDKKLLEHKKALEEGNFRHFTCLAPKDHWMLYEEAKSRGKVLFIDIETTGRQIFNDEITVVGLFDGKEYSSLVMDENLTAESLERELDKYDMLVSHLGLVFDIPFLEYKFPDVNYDLLHFDLSFASKKLGLPEKYEDLREQLIPDPHYSARNFEGFQMIKLWDEYKKGGAAALDLIMEQNREELIRLEKVSDMLFEMLVDAELEAEEEVEEEPIMDSEEPTIIEKEAINTVKAPGAIGPYSQGISCGRMLFISGQLPIDPDTGQLIEGDLALKTERAMNNIGAILGSAGLGFENLVKATIYTTKLNKFSQINEAYGRFFDEDPPARAVVGVASIPKGAEIEIEAIAMY